MQVKTKPKEVRTRKIFYKANKEIGNDESKSHEGKKSSSY